MQAMRLPELLAGNDARPLHLQYVCTCLWLQALSAAESAVLIERALREAGGVRTGGPPKHDATTGVKRKEGEFVCVPSQVLMMCVRTPRRLWGQTMLCKLHGTARLKGSVSCDPRMHKCHTRIISGIIWRDAVPVV